MAFDAARADVKAAFAFGIFSRAWWIRLSTSRISTSSSLSSSFLTCDAHEVSHQRGVPNEDSVLTSTTSESIIARASLYFRRANRYDAYRDSKR